MRKDLYGISEIVTLKVVKNVMVIEMILGSHNGLSVFNTMLKMSDIFCLEVQKIFGLVCE